MKADDDAKMAPVRAIRPRVGYADLERMPEDGHRYELYDGEICVVPAPVPLHQRVAFRIAKSLDAYAVAHGGEVLISPLDIVFSDYDVLQPDVVFFKASRRHLIEPHRAIRSAPDLAVEVLSPSTVEKDRATKMQMYARYGVKEYWLVDPLAHRIEVYWLNAGEYGLAHTASEADSVQSSLLADLKISAATLFVQR